MPDEVPTGLLTPRDDLQVSYRGRPSQQCADAYTAFAWLLREEQPELIVELGTGAGGFSLFLDEYKPRSSRFITYDIQQRSTNAFECRIADVCTLQVLSEVAEMVKRSNRAIILCDGGSKVSEFNFYARVLRSGDLIGAHDYAQSWQYFLDHIKGCCWNHFEIGYFAIADTVRACCLAPVRPELFNNAAWCLFRKE